MGNNNELRLVLGSLRYKSAPNTDFSLKVPFVQNIKEIIEFDRTVDVELEQVFIRERTNSKTFRPSAKFQILFKNSYSGSTNYTPFENNLYYLNALRDAAKQCDPAIGPLATSWIGLPQYYEFDFIRTDFNVPGYSAPPNEHRYFQTQSASTYNWNFFMSYPFTGSTGETLQVIFQDLPNTTFTWKAGDGLPYIINKIQINGNSLIAFKCPMKHGLSVGEFVTLKNISGLPIVVNNTSVFQVYSLGLGAYTNEDYVFTIYDLGYPSSVFSNLNMGTFKRVINDENVQDTTSQYYIRKHKILSSVNDAVLVNAGFEKNIFGTSKKYESSALTPNNVARVSVKEDSQSYTLSFNVDFDTSSLRDNQLRPITELFITVIWKGYFGWMFGKKNDGGKIQGLQKGWEFNLPFDPGKNYKAPNPWWNINNNYADTGFPIGSYVTNIGTPTNQPPNGFTYIESLKVGDIIDGDFCEWNNFEQKERVISNIHHKIKFNPFVFNIGQPVQQPNNSFGYYYKPLFPVTLKVYSDYIEEGDPKMIENIPDYAYYSSTKKQFVWRDLYDYGYIDSTGRGVSYPFINGVHYPFQNIIFRIIPEGTTYSEQNIILTPIIDNCE